MASEAAAGIQHRHENIELYCISVEDKFLGLSLTERDGLNMRRIATEIHDIDALETLRGVIDRLIRKYRIDSQKCSKCGVTVAENKSKYCGDGSDKDNAHRWVMPVYPSA